MTILQHYITKIMQAVHLNKIPKSHAKKQCIGSEKNKKMVPKRKNADFKEIA